MAINDAAFRLALPRKHTSKKGNPFQASKILEHVCIYHERGDTLLSLKYVNTHAPTHRGRLFVDHRPSKKKLLVPMRSAVDLGTTTSVLWTYRSGPAIVLECVSAVKTGAI